MEVYACAQPECVTLTLRVCLFYAERCGVSSRTIVQPTAHCNVMAVGSVLPETRLFHLAKFALT